MPGPQPQPVPNRRPFQFTFWDLAEVMVGLGLAFALWGELAEQSVPIFVLESIAIGFLIFRCHFAPSRAGLIGFLLACLALCCLCLPAFQTARISTRTGYCANHIQNIAGALRYYHDLHGSFPPAVLRNADEQPMHSWRTLILPYLEYGSTFSQYDFSQPWNSPHNRQVGTDMRALGFLCCDCPSATASPSLIVPTNYFYVVGPGRTNENDELPTLNEMEKADGASETILLIESHGLSVDWFEPRDVTMQEALGGINRAGGQGISSPHEREGRPSRWYPGAHIVLADGSVEFLPATLELDTLHNLLAIDDGQPINWSRIRLNRQPTIVWLIALTISYVCFLYWRHWPRRPVEPTTAHGVRGS